MEDFNKLFKIPTLAMNISRSNPYIEKDKKWVLQFIILHGIYTLGFIVILYNIIFHDLKHDDFSQACKNGTLSVVYIVVTYQYCILLYHRRGLIELIEDIKKDFQLSTNLSIQEQKVMSKYAKKGVWICKQWLTICTVGASLFVVKNIILFAYYIYIGEPKLVELYDLFYPDIIERNKSNIIVFSSIYALLLFQDCFSGVMYVAFVPLGPIFMLHACGQLELVEGKVKNIFEDNEDVVIKMKISDIIQHLQYVYRFVDRINACFKVTYELSMKATTIILPLTCYEIIEAFHHGEISLEFIAFIVGGTLFSSSPCFYSDLLMEKGEDVRLAVYTSGWEGHYDLRTRSTLQLMLLRALCPIAIRAMFRTVGLDALTDLFHQSYAIFNLMNAMWK